MDSLFTKRLPGDIRGSLNAVKSIAANLGKLSFVLFSLFTDVYFDHIYQSMEIVSMFDALVFFFTMTGFLLSGWELDKYVGTKALKKNKLQEKKLKALISSHKGGSLLVTKNGKLVIS